jgi:flagellar FliL protein
MVAPSDSKPETAGGEPAVPARGGGKPWLPVLLSVVLAPAASFAVAEFILLPRLQSKLQASLAPGEAPVAAAAGHASPAATGGKPGLAASDYEFTNVIVNVAGTLGTRYLKTSFVVTGVKNAPTRSIFETQKGRMTDVALNVLSSLTLADLEEPGSRNVVREKLVTSFNQTLGRKLVEQVYFSDFVIQ